MKFGMDTRNRLSGADLSVRIFQVASMMPVLYLVIASGYPALFASRNVFSFLFSLGVSAVPRLESLALSFLYRVTVSDVVFSMAYLVIALAVGMLAARVLRGKHARTSRRILAGWIALDLLVRVIPLRFNLAFGLPAAILSFAVRVFCLVLVLLDLRADRKADTTS